MNTDHVVLLNPQVGQIFIMPEGPRSQEYVILHIWDFSDKPTIKQHFNNRGVIANLTLRKPNGKVQFMTPLCNGGIVWRATIKRVPRKFN